MEIVDSTSERGSDDDVVVLENLDEDSDDDVVVLEVPKLIHVDHRFYYLEFKEWYQVHGWRFAPGSTWTPNNSTEQHYSNFLGYHDRSFSDRSNTENGKVPDDSTYIALMYVTWLRRWIPPAAT